MLRANICDIVMGNGWRRNSVTAGAILNAQEALRNGKRFVLLIKGEEPAFFEYATVPGMIMQQRGGSVYRIADYIVDLQDPFVPWPLEEVEDESPSPLCP